MLTIERLCKNGIYLMLLNNWYLLRNFTIISLLLVALIGIKAYAQEATERDASESLDVYAELKSIQNLNTDKNRLFIKILIADLAAGEHADFQAASYALIAKLETKAGYWQVGKHYLDLAITRLARVKKDHLYLDTLESISAVFLLRGEYFDTIEYVRKIADYAYETKNTHGEIVALNRLALSYIQLNLFQLAIKPLQTSLSLTRETNNYFYEFLSTMYLIYARINLPEFDPQETLDLIEVAEKIPSRLNNENGNLFRFKGLVQQQIGNFSAADKWLKLALTKARSDQDMRLLQVVNKDLAALYLAIDKPLLALDYAIKSLGQNNQMLQVKARADTHYLISNIYLQMGDDENSLKHLRAYADLQLVVNKTNTISLITTMEKRIDDIKTQQKKSALENSLLMNKVMAEEHKNKQQLFIFIITALALTFCFCIIVFFVRHRMLKAQVITSMKDGLTGLFCRSYLKIYLPAIQSRFERETNSELTLGALIIDCDDFKFINDTFGHAGGDKALKAIVNTISRQIREHDLLLRWGGDEFVLICESVSHSQMRELANRIIGSINELLIEYDAVRLSVTISAGYALHNKAENFNFDGLIKAADAFLLATKKSGKNNYLGQSVDDAANLPLSNNFSTETN